MSGARYTGVYLDTVAALQRCIKLGGTKDTTEVVSQCSTSQYETPTESPNASSANLLEKPVYTCGMGATSDNQTNQVDRRTRLIKIIGFKDETQIDQIMHLITKDLSEPYSIYTYRYFIHGWPDLCILAIDDDSEKIVGAVVCKLDAVSNRRKGYIAMLAVDSDYRKMGIGTKLVQQAIERMLERGCDEVVLETEVTNEDAARLYSNLGFIREKRLFRYYLNGRDAFRLKLYFSPPASFHQEVI